MEDILADPDTGQKIGGSTFLRTYLLRLLGNHDDQGEVVHPQRCIKERVCVNQENYVFHCLFDHIWMRILIKVDEWTYRSYFVPDNHLANEAGVLGRTRDQGEFLQHGQ